MAFFGVCMALMQMLLELEEYQMAPQTETETETKPPRTITIIFVVVSLVVSVLYVGCVGFSVGFVL